MSLYVNVRLHHQLSNTRGAFGLVMSWAGHDTKYNLGFFPRDLRNQVSPIGTAIAELGFQNRFLLQSKSTPECSIASCWTPIIPWGINRSANGR